MLVHADAASSAAQLRDVLLADGYQVRMADDADRTWTAASYFGDERPDLIVVDGIERYRRIRSYVDVPVIVLSVRREEQVKALDSGAEDCVLQPFGADELRARFERSSGVPMLSVHDRLSPRAISALTSTSGAYTCKRTRCG